MNIHWHWGATGNNVARQHNVIPIPNESDCFRSVGTLCLWYAILGIIIIIFFSQFFLQSVE